MLRNVHIEGGGKLTLDGFDAAHRLGMLFDNVTIVDPAKMKVTAEHADLAFPDGAPISIQKAKTSHLANTGGKSKPNACQEMFVPFPGKISVKE